MFGVKKRLSIDELSPVEAQCDGEKSAQNPKEKPKEKSTTSKSRRGRLWLWVGSVCLVGAASGLTYGWLTLQQELAPLVEKEFSDFLNRPVKLGSVEGLSLSGVRFGKSEILPTPNDPAKVSLEAIEITFNPLQLLAHSQLNLNITAIKPDVYLEQGINGAWLVTPIDSLSLKKIYGVRIKLDSLRAQNADVVLVARSGKGKVNSPVKLFVPSLKTDFTSNSVDFDLIGKFFQGGKVRLSGEVKSQDKEIKLVVSAHEVNAADLGNLIILPFELESGKVSGDLEINLDSKHRLSSIQGIASLEDITAQIPYLPQPLTETNGQLRFDKTRVDLETVTTQLGSISAVANGSLDLHGQYAIIAQSKPFPVQDALKSLRIKPPSTPISAEVESKIIVKGAINHPQVSLTLSTTKPATIDKIPFQSINTTLKLHQNSITISNFKAFPLVGGELNFIGNIPFPFSNSHESNFLLNFSGSNLPAQAIARIYQTTLPKSVGNISAQGTLSGKLNNLETLQGNATAIISFGGGNVKVENIEYRDKRWQGKIEAQRIKIASLGLDIPENIHGGYVNASLNVEGNTESLSFRDIGVYGTANLAIAGGKVTLNNLQLNQGIWQTEAQAQGIRINQIIPDIQPQFNGFVQGNFSLAGNLGELQRIRGEGNITLPSGTIQATQINLDGGNWNANLQTKELKVASLIPNLPTPLQQGNLGVDLRIKGNLKGKGKIETIRGVAALNLPSGTIRAENLEVKQGKVTTHLIPEQVRLAQFSSQLQGYLDGDLKIALDLNNLSTDNIKARGTLNFSQGISLIEHPLTTVINWDENRLNIEKATAKDFLAKGFVEVNSQNLLGNNSNLAGLDSNINPLGVINKFELNVNASKLNLKHLRIPDTIGGRKIPAQLHNYGGWLDFDGVIQGTIDNPQIEGEIALTGLNIANINFEPVLTGSINLLPTSGINLDLGGVRDKIHITLNSKNLPPLSRGARGDSSANLPPLSRGARGDSSANLPPLSRGARGDSSTYELVFFEVKLDRMQVKGNYQNSLLSTTAQNIPLGLIKDLAPLTGTTIPANLMSQPIGGELSGKFVINTNNETSPLIKQGRGGFFHFNLEGENVTIIKPRLGRIQGDSLTGNIQIDNGDLILTRGKFRRNESQYQINASITQSESGPRFNGDISISQGEIQDVLETLQIFEIADLSTEDKPQTYTNTAPLWQQEKKNPSTSPYPLAVGSVGVTTSISSPLFEVGLPNGTLSEQLNYLAQVDNFLESAQQKRKANHPLPKLEQLQGKFNGKLILDAAQTTGINAKFDFQGQDWQWGNIKLSHLQAKGNFNNGLLTFEPAKIHIGNSALTFTGKIDQQSQIGQLQLVKIPLDIVKEFVTIPANFDFGGLVNLNINLGGNRNNPQFNGNLTITDGRINKTPIQSTLGEFTYQNSRLTFAAKSVLNQQNAPIKLKGSIPYQFPLSKVKPDSEKLSLNIQAKNQGLAILDVISQGQLSWLGGQGEVNLDIAGKFNRQKGIPTDLIADGIASFENGIIAAQILPDIPLTQVNGKILFNLDQMQVESLNGKFSGGKVSISGILPLLQPKTVSHPLTMNIDGLTLKLKDLYHGDVDGKIQVLGSFLKPQIAGNINLSDGQIFLKDAINNKINAQENRQSKTLFSSTNFNNLKLNLGNNIWISSPPILNFLARGDLTLNGTLSKPNPEGIIKLKAGQVNLFSAQFGLVGGETNTAQFIPSRGLDPYLDVSLIAAVSETTRNVVRTNPLSSEINDNSAFPGDSLQTVRIQARVDGFTSQLTNSIDLTSLPPRSKTEIVNLLGGNLVNSFSGGDATLGLANLAGSAVFGTIQGPISHALGLSDFRIYPAPLINDKERISSYQLGVVAEASVDLRPNLSVSVQKTINTERPPQWGLRYRVNEHTVIRGSSNFSDDSRAIIEYENRF